VLSSLTPLRRLLLTLRFSKPVSWSGFFGPVMIVSKKYAILWGSGDRNARLPNLPRHRISDPSRSFDGFDVIGVPIQDRQIETISQKMVVLGGKVLLYGLEVSREGFQHRTSLR
jgi:hypothetical protein